MNAPRQKVFISYSRDSDEHAARVRELANKLRRDDVDVTIDDDMLPGGPPEGWPKWSTDRVKYSDRVLLVITKRYRESYEGSRPPTVSHGSRHEAIAIEQELYNKGGYNKKFRVILFDEDHERHIPTQLQRYHHFRLYTTGGYLELLKWIQKKQDLHDEETGAPPQGREDWANALVLISSSDDNSTQYATGFVLSSEEVDTCILTACSAIAGRGDRIFANGEEAYVARFCPSSLALLRTRRLDAEGFFPIKCSIETIARVIVLGLEKTENTWTSQRVLGQIEAPMEASTEEREAKGWRISMLSDHRLQNSFLGSPVIHAERNGVIGLLTGYARDGREGFVHSIASLQDLWPELPRHEEVTNAIAPARRQIEQSYQRQDWGDAPQVSILVGREHQVATLEDWLREDRCRVIAIFGIGGIGKTAVVVTTARSVQDSFSHVIWRSLINAPPLQELLSRILLYLSRTTSLEPSAGDINDLIAELLALFERHRCLLVLDNLESIVDPLEREQYGKLIRRIADAGHNSCLVLTSRARPSELEDLEGEEVKSLELGGLSTSECVQLLTRFGIDIAEDTALADWEPVASHCSGNPLFVRLLPAHIKEMHAGDSKAFLSEFASHPHIFGKLATIIESQFRQLSPFEQALMFWLAIEREPVSPSVLSNNFLQLPNRRDLTDSLWSLRRQSLVETSGSRFGLQNVLLEFVSETFTGLCVDEFVGGDEPALLTSHSMVKATAMAFVYDAQVRIFLRPIASRLRASFQSVEMIERRAEALLNSQRKTIGYLAGNVLNVLREMDVDLTGYDLSDLTIWEANLRNVPLRDVNLSRSSIARTVFSERVPSVFSVDVSPDASRVATGDYGGAVSIWRVADRKRLFSVRGHAHAVWAVAFNHDGSLLVSSSDDKEIIVWKVIGNEIVLHAKLDGHNDWVRTITFSRDGTMLASGSYDSSVRLWNVDTDSMHIKESAVLTGHEGWVRAVSFSPDGRLLASAGEDRVVRLWRVDQGTLSAILEGHEGPVFALAFSVDGRTLASGGADKCIKLWHIDSELQQECVATLNEHTSEIYSLAFGFDGQLLASCGQDGTIRLWDVKDYRHSGSVSSFAAHDSWIWSVAFASNDEFLVSGSADQTIKLWDVRSIGKIQCMDIWEGGSAWVRTLAFLPGGCELISGGADRMIRLWEVSSGREMAAFEAHGDQVEAIAVSPDGRVLASAGWDGLAKLWSLESLSPIATLSDHASTPWSVAFSPDGRFLVTGSNDFTVRLWDMEGRCLQVLQDHDAQVYSVSFNSTGTLLATAGFDSTVRIWDTGNLPDITCQRVLRTRTCGEMITSTAFSPDSRFLAAGSRSNVVTLWDTASGKIVETLEGHDGWIYSLCFAREGSILASGSSDHTVRLWNIKSCHSNKTSSELRGVLDQHTEWVFAVAINEDGTCLASGSADETIKLWDIDTGRCKRTLRATRLYEGMDITGVHGLSNGERETLLALGAKVSPDATRGRSS